jgi:hypothetical protein
MTPVVQFLVVLIFFVVVNVVGAGLFYGLFSMGQWFVPSLMESPLFVYPLGLLALGGTILFAMWGVNAFKRSWFQSMVRRLSRRN